MRTLVKDVLVGLLLAFGVVLVTLCSTFNSTFLYQGF